MINTLLFDLSWVLLFPVDEEYLGKLNPLHASLSKSSGYRVEDHFRLNEELLEYLQKQKNKFDLFIFTSGAIQNAPFLKERLVTIFERIFSAKEIGKSKKDPEAYEYIARELGKKADEILFVDDYLPNLQAALKVGMRTMHYQSNEQLIGEINKL